MAVAPPHPFLSSVHLATHSAVVPLHAHVFGVCPSGSYQARAFQRPLFGHTPHPQMPSVGRQRLRPGALNEC